MQRHQITASNSHGISHVRIFITNDEIIKSTAVAMITNADVSSSIPGGIYDQRLGTHSYNVPCITCGMGTLCPGHFGWYDLKQYVYNPITIDDIPRWLKVVCVRCGELLLDQVKVQSFPILKRLTKSADVVKKNKQCNVCNHVQPKIDKDKKYPFNFALTYPTTRVELSPGDIKMILERISDRTNALFGRLPECHPKNYILSKFIISPVTIRPYFKNSEHQNYKAPPIVEFTKNIIKKSNDVVDRPHYISRCLYDMVRGGTAGGRDVNVIGGAPSDAITKQFNGKKGIPRNLQMGHRRLNSARCTISGNPNMPITYVGIPKYIKNILQVSETVRSFNRHRLMAIILAGKCRRITVATIGGTSDREKMVTPQNMHRIILHDGDIVHREIIDGDTVILNRSPSLIETSMSCHTAHIFNDPIINTFQINASACVGYNADFDGDVMRLSPPRTIRARVEGLYINTINRWFLSNQYSRALHGELQDGVVGSALLTKTGVEFDKLHAIRCFGACLLNYNLTFDKSLYTGRDLVSMLLKNTPITYKKRAKFFNSSYKELISYKNDEINVSVNNGVLETGVLDKSSIGNNSNGGLFHVIGLKYGSNVAMDLIHKYQQLALSYLSYRGFSLGITDLIITKQNRLQLNTIVAEQITKSTAYMDTYMRGSVFPPVGMTTYNYYEREQMKLLAHSNALLPPILNSMDLETNTFFQMIMYGAKGDVANLLKILSNVGQIKTMGSRVSNAFSPGRSSIYYARFDISPKAKGFIDKSLIVGLDLIDSSMASIEAREQLVQKSQGTAISGAVYRVHAKALESCIINNFRVVMKSVMAIQLMYGDIGIDSRHLYKQKFEEIFMSTNDIKQKYIKATPDEINRILVYRDTVRCTLQKLNTLTNYQITANGNYLLVSVNVSDIVHDVLNKYHGGVYKEIANDTTLNKLRDIVKQYIHDIPYNFSNDIMRKRGIPLPNAMTKACFILQMFVAYTLTTDILVYCNEQILDDIIQLINLKHKNTMCIPGMSCGYMAAQCIGEPLTQGMLDALHGKSGGVKSGLSSLKETMGLKELQMLDKSLTIKFKEPFCYNKIHVEKMRETINVVTVEDIVTDWQIFLEGNDNPIHPDYKHEAEYIKNYLGSFPNTLPTNISKWNLRFTLNKHIMALKYISVENLTEKLYESIGNIFIIPHKLYIRIYVLESEFMKVIDVESHITNTLFNTIVSQHIKGVPKISDAKIMTIDKYVVNSDTGSFDKKQEYVIRTVGSNHMGLMCEVGEDDTIDFNQILTNDITEVKQLFGVEATRLRIINQIMDNLDGRPLAFVPLSLYADTMTWTGDLLPLDASTAAEKNKTLLKISTNHASMNVITSAKIGVYEEVTGVSSSIMLGKVPSIGTHYNNILMDEQMIAEKSRSIMDTINSL